MAITPKHITEKDNTLYGLLHSIKNNLETLIGLKVNKTGDTMTGNLSIQTDGGICTLTLGGSTIIKQAGEPIVLSTNIRTTTFDGHGQVTTKVSINSEKVFFPVQAPTATAPAYVKGGLYFDTTLNKLRVGGVAAWETVTSV